MTESSYNCETRSRACERRDRVLGLLTLTILALPAFLLACAPSLLAEKPADIAVSAQTKRLNVEDWNQNKVGALTWRGGLELTSPAANFGGLSGLLISPDGSRLTAVTDQGHWLTGELTYDSDGNSTGLENATMGELLDEEGAPLVGKEHQDAESLARLKNGDLLVSFERDHRVWRYPDPGVTRDDQTAANACPPETQSVGEVLEGLNDQNSGSGVTVYPPLSHCEIMLPIAGGMLALDGTESQESKEGETALAGPATPLRLGETIHTLSANKGLEALVELENGRFLAFAEGATADGLHPVLFWNRVAWHQLAYRGVENHRPTGATLLPSGDILLLERRFTTLGGLSIRLGILSRDDIQPGATLQSREIARLLPPLTIDNFEGVAAWLGPRGETLIALLSDDNFSPLQRTLLLVFELQE